MCNKTVAVSSYAVQFSAHSSQTGHRVSAPPLCPLTHVFKLLVSPLQETGVSMSSLWYYAYPLYSNKHQPSERYLNEL